MKRTTVLTLGALAASALLIAGCSSPATPSSSDTGATPSASGAPSPGTGTGTGSPGTESGTGSPGAESGSGSKSAEPSPSQSTILAVLCDEAAPSQAKAIKAAIRPEFKVSQLVDVRTDDKGQHAVLGFVEGPGLSVLAVWYGTGMNLEGLASADDLAAQASKAEKGTPDEETTDLIGQTVSCYQTLFAPEGFS